MPGTLFVVATPIGNLEDITARALRVLGSVAVIAAEDTRRTAKLLAHYGITTRMTSLHAHNEHAKVARLLERLAAGDDVAIVSDAGTPTISDPGRLLVRAAHDASVRIVPIPGPSAVVTLLSASGFDTDSFTFLGFPPVRSKDRNKWMDRFAATEGVVVFFEAPHRIQGTLKDIQARVGDVDAFLGRELTKQFEQLVKRPISTIFDGAEEPRGEYVVAVNLGQKTDKAPAFALDAAEWPAEVGRIAKLRGLKKRAASAILAKRLGLSANTVYAAVAAAENRSTAK